MLPLDTGFINVYIFSPPELDESWGDGIIGVPGPGGPLEPGGPWVEEITYKFYLKCLRLYWSLTP
jgi:hypothetical protein